MIRVTVDNALRNKLQNLEQPLELVDDLGRVLGKFVPLMDKDEFDADGLQASEVELEHDRITVDDALRSKLKNLERPLELVDESGRMLGRVFPVLDWDDIGSAGPQVSDEELDRRERSNERRYTTAEVLAYLEKL